VNSGLRIGTTVVGHRIEELLGRGGMGFVYKAEQLELGRKVALKVLAPDLVRNVEYRTRFINESRLAAGIEHPNIIPIYASGEGDGILYISMRFIDGEDLGGVLDREQRLHTGRALNVLGQIGNALDAAHRQGLVHRDVKPANIMVTPPAAGEAAEHAWLCDFGLVKHFDSVQNLTATGVFMGTIQYVAPEQIEGRRLDGRADVYALACVLYECLTGVVPFERDSDVATLYAHIHDPAPATRLVRPDLPDGIDAVFAKALAKSRDDRFPTCADLMKAARSVLEGGRAAVPTAPQQGQPQPPVHPGFQSPGGYGVPPRQAPHPGATPGYGRQAGYGRPEGQPQPRGHNGYGPGYGPGYGQPQGPPPGYGQQQPLYRQGPPPGQGHDQGGYGGPPQRWAGQPPSKPSRGRGGIIAAVVAAVVVVFIMLVWAALQSGAGGGGYGAPDTTTVRVPAVADAAPGPD
jgi:serine/threonine-protein kinase